MRKPPTDLKILRRIYRKYYSVYSQFSRDAKNREAKVYVPIDVNMIAEELKTDKDIIFGRLYYDLEKKYGYKQDDGSHVSFFAQSIGKDKHCIQFPYMSSILALLENENKKYKTAIGISFISLLIAIVSLMLSIFL